MTRRRPSAVPVLALVLGVLLGAAAPLAAAEVAPPATTTTTLGTTLTGARVPGGDPDGFGSAVVTVTAVAGEATVELCAQLAVRGIGPATGAWLRRGAVGLSGTNVAELTPPDAAGSAYGCVAVAAATGQRLATTPGAFQVTVATADFPEGALRGTLDLDGVEGHRYATVARTTALPGALAVVTVTASAARLCVQVEAVGVNAVRRLVLRDRRSTATWSVGAVAGRVATCRSGVDPVVLEALAARPGDHIVDVRTADADAPLSGRLTPLP